MLDCRDPVGLSRWWCEVLDQVELSRDPDESVGIGPREGSVGAEPTLVRNAASDDRRGELPLHVDVDDRRQGAELERLLELGARRADVGQGDPGTVSRVVLADPERLAPL